MKENLAFEMKIRPLKKNEELPYALLLDADPSKTMVDEYLAYAEVFVACFQEKIIGVYVCCPLDIYCLEIKNIAVAEGFQGKGIGQEMLQDAFRRAREKGYTEMQIGTSPSSIGPLYLYQKAGFEVSHIIKNFFTDHYPEPLFENGIQCKHMIVLKKLL